MNHIDPTSSLHFLIGIELRRNGEAHGEAWVKMGDLLVEFDMEYSALLAYGNAINSDATTGASKVADAISLAKKLCWRSAMSLPWISSTASSRRKVIRKPHPWRSWVTFVPPSLVCRTLKADP